MQRGVQGGWEGGRGLGAYFGMASLFIYSTYVRPSSHSQTHYRWPSRLSRNHQESRYQHGLFG